MINEKNFVSANEEDIEPSYVDAVVGNHDKSDEAHSGLFRAIDEKMDKTKAFYEEVKSSVDGVAEAAKVSCSNAEKAQAVAVRAKADAEVARDRAEEAAVKYPYIGDNGNWFVWDVGLSMFEDSGVKASGGGSIEIDDAMSDTSENAVKNCVIKEYVDDSISEYVEEVSMVFDELHNYAQALISGGGE